MDTPTEVRIGAKGRLVIPADVRQAAGIDEGSVLIARAEGAGRVVLETRDSIKRRLLARAAEAKPSYGVVDRLIDERRTEERADAARRPPGRRARAPK